MDGMHDMAGQPPPWMRRERSLFKFAFVLGFIMGFGASALIGWVYGF